MANLQQKSDTVNSFGALFQLSGNLNVVRHGEHHIGGDGLVEVRCGYTTVTLVIVKKSSARSPNRLRPAEKGLHYEADNYALGVQLHYVKSKLHFVCRLLAIALGLH